MSDFEYNDGTSDFPSFTYIDDKKAGASIFESAGDRATSATDFTDKQLRSTGMSVVLTWVDDGEFSINALDAIIQGISDLDGDGEVQADSEEETYYNDLYNAVGAAMASLGADADAIGKFIDDEDDGAGESIGSMLAKKMDSVDSPDEAIISDYTLGGAADAVMESTIKVVRGGKIVLKKKRLRRIKISSAQRASIKKAGLKAHTSVAKHNRAKSMKARKQHGL